MGAVAKAFITPQQYLVRERAAAHKSEYWNGQIFAMAGASEEHVLISLNSAAALRDALRTTSCRVYSSDMRVRVRSHNLYTYPDVSVVCGQRKFDTEELDVLLNPVLIIEVLSPSTERHDRVGKFSMYSSIDSLREYILISQSEVHVERYLRRPGGKWILTEANRLKDSIKLASVPAILKLKDLYRQVDF